MRSWLAALILLPALAAGAAGEPPPSGAGSAGDAPTTVVVVRHAEQLHAAGDDDPGLSDVGRRRSLALADALRSLPIDAVYATTYRRARETVEPLAAARGLEIRIVDPTDVEGLARRILAEHRGDVVLSSGHSNTVPGLLIALGVEEAVTLDHRTDFDGLFIVTVRDGAARLLRLHYGEPTLPPDDCGSEPTAP